MPQRIPIHKKQYIRPRSVYTLRPDEYIQIKKALVDMYSSWGNVDDPEMKADIVIKQCCEAKTPKGRIWRSAPDELPRRFAIYGLDYAKMAPIPDFHESRIRGGNIGIKHQGKKTGQIPRELQLEGKSGNAIGSSSLLSNDEDKGVQKKYKQLLNQLPHLDNALTRDDVYMLAKLYIIGDRITTFALDHNKLPSNVNFDSAILGNIERLKKSLDIDVHSLNRDRDDLNDGSVGQLIREFYDYIDDDNFWKHEIELFLEELAMLLRKYERADENGMPEINEVVFRNLTGGLSPEEASYIISNPYCESVEDLIEQAKNYSAQKNKIVMKEHVIFVGRLLKKYGNSKSRVRNMLHTLGYSQAEINNLVPHQRLLVNVPKEA